MVMKMVVYGVEDGKVGGDVVTDVSIVLKVVV